MTAASWCMIVMQNTPCKNIMTGAKLFIPEPVAAFGPFDKVDAQARVDHFNDGSDPSMPSDPPEYRPLPDAPVFINQADWPEHWAVLRPMNDMPEDLP